MQPHITTVSTEPILHFWVSVTMRISLHRAFVKIYIVILIFVIMNLFMFGVQNLIRDSQQNKGLQEDDNRDIQEIQKTVAPVYLRDITHAEINHNMMNQVHRV